MQGLLEGLAAGYGIAVPVGAVSILIFTTGMKSGFRRGFAAGAGAATADLVYAAAASVAGSALVLILQPAERVFRVGGGLVLILMAAWGLAQVFRSRGQRQEKSVGAAGLAAARRAAEGSAVVRPGATYIQLLGITLVNPLTVVYFAALILGRAPGSSSIAADRLAFVLGAAVGSLSWQTLLALLGSLLHGRLPSGFRRGAVIAGNLIVAALGARILVLALR
jgi:threonine/homoserine/homoserine lactone efflux protein